VPFQFNLLNQTESGGRRAQLVLPHQTVEAPVFMPVGTAGTVKAVPQDVLEILGAQIILGNTYHLYLRPGHEAIRRMGGLHRFMSWPHGLLTDSGGFQVFSLSQLREVTDEGVRFRSHLDGSSHFFTPEHSMDVQIALGADIAMAFDECTEYPAERPRAQESLRLTMAWARRSLDHFRAHREQVPWHEQLDRVPPVSPLRPGNPPSPSAQLSFPNQVQALFRSRRLIATFAVGFNVLFSLVGVFTWITFHLSAAPYSLSTTALSSLFFVYLVGLVVTPAAGFLITRVGLRAGIAGALACSMAGVLLTLAASLWIVIFGLALVSSGVFIAQTASQSHLRVAAPPGARVTAAGLYMTCYYLGGTAAGVVPGAFWALGKWPACAAFIVAMQAVAMAIALAGWRSPTMASTALIQNP